MGKESKPDRTPAEDGNLERDVHCALKATGWLTPETEQDVEAAQAELASAAVSLPDALQDAEAVFAGESDRASIGEAPLAFTGDVDVERNLARAAREGGPIPTEIERIMREDRLAAERELDGTDDGEDVG